MPAEGGSLIKLLNRDLKSGRIFRWNHKARTRYFRREPRILFGHRDEWPSRRKDCTKLGRQDQIGRLGLLRNQVKIGSCHQLVEALVGLKVRKNGYWNVQRPYARASSYLVPRRRG